MKRFITSVLCSLALLVSITTCLEAFPFDVDNDIRSGLEQDNRVVCFNEKAYIIGRAGQYASGDGTITVLSLDALAGAPEANYSLGIGSNPYDIAFHDATKAYVSRYNVSDVVIIDPRDGTQLGTFVPSDYGCSAYANVSYLHVVQTWNGFSRLESRLFVAVQDGWGNPGKVLVFDTDTDTHLATIPLTLQNPNADLDYNDGQLYVSCTGDWSTPSTAGIQVIDVMTQDISGYTYPTIVLATATDLDDDAVTVHDIEIVNNSLWFVVVGKNFGYDFNIVKIDPYAASYIEPLYAAYTSDYIGELKAYMPAYLFINRSDKQSSTGTDFPVYDFMKEVFIDPVSAGTEVVYALAAHREMVLATSSNYDWASPAGYLNSIVLDNPAYTFAAAVVESLVRGPIDISDPGGDVASYGNAADALGAPDGSVVSLGDGGSIVVSFGENTVLDNIAGPDFGVYENGFFQNWPINAGHTGYFFELAFVEVSSDGVNFARFPTRTVHPVSVSGFDTLQPLDYFGFAGNSLGSLCINYDLDDLADDSLVLDGTVDLDLIRYVRIEDVIGDGSTYDSIGNPVYDPYPTAFSSGGFDFDAVEAFVTGDPSLIRLAGLEAVAGNRSVTIVWETESEVDNAGFNIYRSESGDEYEMINEGLIPAEGSPTEGSVYSFVDDDVNNRKIYYYKLEDVDFNGAATLHGPVSAMPRRYAGQISGVVY